MPSLSIPPILSPLPFLPPLFVGDSSPPLSSQFSLLGGGGETLFRFWGSLEGGILAVGSWTRIACYTQESPAEAAVELGGTFTVAVAAEPSGTPTPSATHWPAAGTLGATPEPTTAP